MSGIHGVWPFRRVEIFGSPMHGKIKNEREVDNMWWGAGKRSVIEHEVMGCRALILNMRSIFFLQLIVKIRCS